MSTMISQWHARKRPLLFCGIALVLLANYVIAKASNEPSVAHMSADEIEDALHVRFPSQITIVYLYMADRIVAMSTGARPRPTSRQHEPSDLVSSLPTLFYHLPIHSCRQCAPGDPLHLWSSECVVSYSESRLIISRPALTISRLPSRIMPPKHRPILPFGNGCFCCGRLAGRHTIPSSS